MTDPATTPSPQEQLDLLISRIADGEASERDWSSFTALAESRPHAWKDLAQAQRDHQALSLAVGVALHAADHVELPSRDAADAFLRRGRHSDHRILWSRVRQVSGWAVAAVVALMWLTSGATIRSANIPNSQDASLIPAGYFRVDSPDDALQLYRNLGKQAGRIQGEVPVLVESRPATTGKGFEVIYVRQILEKAQVDNLMRFAQDEAGRMVPVRVTMPARAQQAE